MVLHCLVLNRLCSTLAASLPVEALQRARLCHLADSMHAGTAGHNRNHSGYRSVPKAVAGTRLPQQAGLLLQW